MIKENTESKTTIIEFIGGMREGGAESLVTDYARLIDTKRFRVVVVSVNPLDERSPYVKILNSENRDVVSVYDHFPVCKTYIGQKIWNKAFHRRYVAKRLLNYVKKYKADVVHVHLEILNYLSPIIDDLKNVKIFYTCHSSPERYFNNTSRRCELETAIKLFKECNFRIIALHQKMKQEIDKLFKVNTTIIIHNGVDFGRFLNITETKEEIRKTIDIPARSFVVGHVGRFAEAKNHPFIVKVFKEVLARRDDAFLLLVGTGPMLEEINSSLLSEGFDGKYMILSFRSDIPRIMKAMDVFLFPSFFEGLPVTLVEAQVSGLRCVVSDRINTESFFLPTLITLTLDEPASVWADAVVDDTLKGEYNKDISVFDMNKEIKRLERLYEEE